LLLKANELCLVTDQSGTVRAPAPGMGLFYRDCCYLDRYELRLQGRPPLLLAASAALGFAATVELTNQRLPGADGRPIRADTLGIERRLIAIHQDERLLDWLRFRNFDEQLVELTLSLTFEARFEDIFKLRGALPGRRGRLDRPEVLGDGLLFSYRGADGVLRRLEVAFSSAVAAVAPRSAEVTSAHFDLALGPQQSKDLIVQMRPIETHGGDRQASRPSPVVPTVLEAHLRRRATSWLDGFAEVRSECPPLDDAIRRSLSDLRLLRVRREGDRFIAGGIPWYLALFGRDSIVPALQCLAFRPELAACALRTLARRQGRGTDPERGEQPGKILHELRVGELARLDEVRETPSFMSVDSTILFLILLGWHARWTGSLALFLELRAQAERALAWLARYGDSDRDGYIDYGGGRPEGQLVNQGWKDSGDGIVRADGSLPEPPIALAEVQGYAYLAKTSIARLYAQIGDVGAADRLRQEADALRECFNRDFWLQEEGCYCLGLERDGRPLAVVTSNAGQVLWTGIADPDKARRTVLRLMQDDMFSGWGIRTLTSRARKFNPFSYHLGSVWQFDNSLILAGFRASGEGQAALRLWTAMLDAAGHFPNRRLPEFFAGSAREPGSAPAHCPRADPLQAWSAGAFPLMLTALLGLEPEGLSGRLRVVRPVLPAETGWLDLKRLRIGQSVLNLHFARGPDDRVSVAAEPIEGDVTVIAE
jgi:glycogen debranching enzyme